MKISEFIRFWHETVPHGWENTCDHLHYGDPETVISKIAVVFKITLHNLGLAAAAGANLIITHEPLYPRYDGFIAQDETDPVALALHDRLKETGMAVLRLHDHIHIHTFDFIHRGYIERLGLPIQFANPPYRLGFTQYGLARAYTMREIAELSARHVDMPHPRMAGDPDAPITRVTLALGGTGSLAYDILSSTDTELFITGETDELSCAFYANEAAALGKTKNLLVLGHCESEQFGMDYLAKWIHEQLPCLETQFFLTAPTYQY